jgi:hypothetical protein
MLPKPLSQKIHDMGAASASEYYSGHACYNKLRQNTILWCAIVQGVEIIE